MNHRFVKTNLLTKKKLFKMYESKSRNREKEKNNNNDRYYCF